MTGGRKKEKPTSGIISSLSAFSLEADFVSHGLSILVSGVLGILEFSDSSVLLNAGRKLLKIEGQGLAITVYEHNRVEIVGMIERIEFL